MFETALNEFRDMARNKPPNEVSFFDEMMLRVDTKDAENTLEIGIANLRKYHAIYKEISKPTDMQNARLLCLLYPHTPLLSELKEFRDQQNEEKDGLNQPLQVPNPEIEKEPPLNKFWGFIGEKILNYEIPIAPEMLAEQEYTLQDTIIHFWKLLKDGFDFDNALVQVGYDAEGKYDPTRLIALGMAGNHFRFDSSDNFVSLQELDMFDQPILSWGIRNGPQDFNTWLERFHNSGQRFYDTYWKKYRKELDRPVHVVSWMLGDPARLFQPSDTLGSLHSLHLFTAYLTNLKVYNSDLIISEVLTNSSENLENILSKASIPIEVNKENTPYLKDFSQSPHPLNLDWITLAIFFGSKMSARNIRDSFNGKMSNVGALTIPLQSLFNSSWGLIL